MQKEGAVKKTLIDFFRGNSELASNGVHLFYLFLILIQRNGTSLDIANESLLSKKPLPLKPHK